MSRGKRILFIAEKMAALKVVKDRLDSFGLGDFCLEVHSNKTRKATVLKSFEDRLNLPLSPFDDQQLKQALESFERTRTGLLHYAVKMKEAAGDTGLSVYEVLCGNCSRTFLGETLPPGLRKARVQDPMTVTQQQRLEIKELARCLQANAAAVNQWGGLANHPWRGIENQDIDVFASAELKSELGLWAEALESLTVILTEMKAITQLTIDSTGKSVGNFLAQVMRLPDVPDNVVDSVVLKAATAEGSNVIRNLIRDSETQSAVNDRISRVFEDLASVDEIEVGELVEIVKQAHTLQVESLTPEGLANVCAEREQAFVQSKLGAATAVQLGDLLGLTQPRSPIS